MAKKLLDGFGNTPKVLVSISEARKRLLGDDDWFVEYLNTDTRNAIARALELVDHDGDQIFYSGDTVHGFKVTFDKVLFLRDSRHNGVFKFTSYHKRTNERKWRKWIEQMKSPKTIINAHKKAGRLKAATAF